MPEIKLTKGKVAFVDSEDFEAINAFRWHAHESDPGVWYAARVEYRIADGKKIRIRHYMHRVLCDTTPEQRFVDHRDGDGLNNRRYNLRPSTRNENNRNKVNKRHGASSRYLGVSWAERSKKWRVCIRSGPNSKVVYIGLFKDECDAAQAYNFAAEVAFGEFASYNTVAVI